MAMLQHPDAVGRDLAARASGVRFANETLAVVRDAIATSLDALERQDWLATVLAEVPASFTTLVQQLAVAPIPAREDKMGGYCQGVTIDLIDRDLLRRKAELLGALQRTDAATDAERRGRLQRELMNIETERRALRSD
jgi:DNA primase